MVARPRRSVLYMPGSNAKALAKAATLAADALILDLEDSVAPDAKDAARVQVVAAAKGDFGGREVVIRVNGPHTPGGRTTSSPPPPLARTRCCCQRSMTPARSCPQPASCASRRARANPHLGNDGNAKRHSQRRPDRSGGGRFDLPARGHGDGPQRPRQGDPSSSDGGPPDNAGVDRSLRRGRPRPRHRYH